MKKLNLLPWRRAKKALERKILLSVGSLALFIGLVVLTIRYSQLNADIAHLKTVGQRTLSLTQESKKVEKEMQRLLHEAKRLEEDLSFMQGLDGNIKDLCFVVQYLKKLLPKNLMIQEISKKREEIFIHGRVLSMQTLTGFMRQLQQEQWINKPELAQFQLSPGTRENRFLLSFGVKKKGFVI